MPIPRLRPEDTALLVIDLQERLLPTIADADRVVANAAVLLRMAQELGLPYLVTEQYPKGLGRTADAITRSMTDASRRVEKTRFSACVDVVAGELMAGGCRNVLVCGIEAHVCVLQTVLDLQASGRQAFVVSDAVASSQQSQLEPALRRMEAAGAILTGVISAVYELMGDARHPAFRACLELAKAVQY